MNLEPVVVLKDLTFAYNGDIILEDVNLSIADREFVWIVGPNGGGKTTLVKILLGLLRPQKGSVSVFGAPAAVSRRRVGYMPQHARLDPGFPVTALDVVLMGRLNGKVRPGPYSAADHGIAVRALEQVGMNDSAHKALRELSGGQQRRLLIARALACQPDLLLLDEPTANLDRQVERELFEFLKELNKRLTIIMVSHDPAFVSDFVERVVCVNRSVAVHPTSDRDGESIDALYGVHMRMVRHDRHQDKLDQS